MSDITSGKKMTKWKTLWEISEAGPIIRRYFVMNFFDGVLTALGLVLGFMISIFDNVVVYKEILVSTALLTAIAIGTSGLIGSHLAESTERKLNVLNMRKFLGIMDKDGNEKGNEVPTFSETDINRALGKFDKAHNRSIQNRRNASSALRSITLGREEEAEKFIEQFQEFQKKKQEEEAKKSQKVRGPKDANSKLKKNTRKEKKRKRKEKKKELPIFEEAQEFASRIAAIVDGLSPFLGVLIVIIPFILWPSSPSGLTFVPFVISYILTALVLVFLGGFLAKLSKESVVKYGAMMLLAAIITAAFTILF